MWTTHPLNGVKVVELAGLAPGPFAGLLLADYGASVLRIDRAPSRRNTVGPVGLTRRKSSIYLDLKNARSRDLLLSILLQADVLIDPFRPGVLERLGLSPTDVLLRHNPRLVVARMTGFRRDGKYKDMAGHDINYIAVSGVLSMLGRSGETPYAPGNILGDFAGGGAMCFMGILLALISRQTTGKGQVVEANMVDGSAYLATMPRVALTTPLWDGPRGTNTLDGGCPWYDTYETKDPGKYFAVGALEPHFYSVLLKGLGFEKGDVPDRDDKGNWPAIRQMFTQRFKERTRSEWEMVFDGSDACATPVLEQAELERQGYEQRLPVDLVSTPGKPFASEEAGRGGGGGGGGEGRLKEWFGWTRGTEYEERDRVLVSRFETRCIDFAATRHASVASTRFSGGSDCNGNVAQSLHRPRLSWNNGP
ncbi:Isopenicillin N epimerase component 2 [Talaromyces atroroseus]|uniref:Isopenicillin N epimerase component 2 n=1 Tax=Talaromyces atroroseus TaxID=1441469 RepID=A0A225ASQ0_TALAT|nr:Isopenicillin N epimerase component 2 [Talaromyces atroroseus]OKL64010.1 Isopenicillin N epimerase component 2 [Talaromyces atroroseus]